MVKLILLYSILVGLFFGVVAAEEKTHIIFVPQGDDVNAANRAEIEKQRKDGWNCNVTFQRTVLKGAESFTEVTFKCTRPDPEKPKMGEKCCLKMETTETHAIVKIQGSEFQMPRKPGGDGWMPFSINTSVQSTVPGKGRQAITEKILVVVIWFRYVK